MAKLNGSQIRELARRIIAENPGGIRYANMLKQIAAAHPETPFNTITGAAWDIAERYPNEIHKPSRGLYLPGKAGMEPVGPVAPPPKVAREEEFYEPFADWLKSELDEATVAVALGGAGMKQKWGTPDVVGVYKPLASHRIKFPPEIVSAEIKSDPQQPITAFGQSVAYRLFSAKSYLVMPKSISEEDYSRMEALCMLFGIGFVIFEPNPSDPSFEIRVRGQRFYPDMFYVNEFADRLCQLDPSKFNTLFG